MRSQLDAVTSSLIPGLLTGIMVVIMSVTLASLIFTGRLAPFIGKGIALAITTTIIAGLVIALFSRVKPVIAMLDEDTAPVFALLVSFAVAALPLSASGDQIFTAALAIIIASTLLTGLGLALLGIFKFGNFIQFLPHSVLGGYFSAVGWLLVMGGLQVITGIDPATREGLMQMVTISEAQQWLPAVLIGLWLLFMRHRLPQSILLPGTVLIATGAWYAVLSLSGGAPEQAMQQGLLLGPFGAQSTAPLTPLAGLELAKIDWFSIFASSGSMASVFLIAVLSLMLSISGLGLLSRAEPDMNHELKVAGLANIFSGLGGGMIGLPSYSLSSLALNMGAAKERWVGVLAILVCIMVFLFGLDLLAYMPRIVLSGILIYLGLSFLREWLFEGWRKFAPLEYLVIPIILTVSIIAGFVQGVLVGLVAAIVLFVVKYSQTRVVAHATSGSQLMSNVDRTAAAQQVIQTNGDQVLAMSLQGYLFFGTAGQVYDRLRERLREPRRPLRYLLVDFSRVTGLDASAALNFQKMLQLAEHLDFKLITTGMAPDLGTRLNKGGFDADSSNHLMQLTDLDHALEYCENQLLAEFPEQKLQQSCFEQLTDYLSSTEIGQLKGYLVEREVEAGHVLAEQGEESDQLFFLETCAASAYIKGSKNELHRVRHTTRGTVFGELGFYLGIPRTATVITSEAGLVYLLDQKSLLDMERRDPAVAAGLHHYMAMLLSERLMFTTRTLRALLM